VDKAINLLAQSPCLSTNPLTLFFWGATQEKYSRGDWSLKYLPKKPCEGMFDCESRSGSQGCSNVFTDYFGFGLGNFSPWSSPFYIATRLVLVTTRIYLKKNILRSNLKVQSSRAKSPALRRTSYIFATLCVAEM